jgi:LmbE family N-acetylglucosaminyl deacetylase
MRIAVWSPHRDDAGFSLGLAIEAWLRLGHAVEVVDVFTRTEHAPYSDAESLHPNDRASFASAVRKREDEAWVKLYAGLPGRGRLTLTEVGLKDAPLRLHCAEDEVLHREPVLSDKVMQKVQRAMEQARAEAVVLPLGVGGHVDHLTVRLAALPSDAGNVPLAFYEDLPYAAQAPDTVEAAVQASALAAGVPLQSWFAEEARPVDAAVARKRRLALCYDSQIEDATADAIAAFSGLYEGRERLWVNAAWSAAFGAK